MQKWWMRQTIFSIKQRLSKIFLEPVSTGFYGFDHGKSTAKDLVTLPLTPFEKSSIK
jgi:hypothetical protein